MSFWWWMITSTDDTAELAAEAGAEVVKLAPEPGNGGALKAGIDRATYDTRRHRRRRYLSTWFAPTLLEFSRDFEIWLLELVWGEAELPWVRKIQWFLGEAREFLAGQRIPDLNCRF